MSADAGSFRIVRSLVSHGKGTEQYVLAGIITGGITTCTCPDHTLLRDLQAQACADRN